MYRLIAWAANVTYEWSDRGTWLDQVSAWLDAKSDWVFLGHCPYCGISAPRSEHRTTWMNVHWYGCEKYPENDPHG